jgi:hypothetical protein
MRGSSARETGQNSAITASQPARAREARQASFTAVPLTTTIIMPLVSPSTA